MFGKGFNRLEDAGLQPGFVGAAIERRDQVDVALWLAAAFFKPGQRPGGTFTHGKTVFHRDIFFTDKNWRDRRSGHHFRQIIGHAVLIAPGFPDRQAVFCLNFQVDRHIWHQHGFGT